MLLNRPLTFLLYLVHTLFNIKGKESFTSECLRCDLLHQNHAYITYFIILLGKQLQKSYVVNNKLFGAENVGFEVLKE